MNYALIVDELEEIDLNSDQLDKLIHGLEEMGIDILNEDDDIVEDDFDDVEDVDDVDDIAGKLEEMGLTL